MGEARRLAAVLARRLGFGEVDAGRLALVVSEAASNLHKHAVQGEIVLTPMTADWVGVDVLALDRGPGMEDVFRNLQDGFSTAGSPGTGLGAITRQADDYDLYSQPRSGTAVWARVKRRDGTTVDPAHLEVGAVNIPLPGEDRSGDAWVTLHRPGRPLVMLVDGLGHGPEAAEAAAAAVNVLEDHPKEEPAGLLELVHAALRHTRGAAAAVAEIRPALEQVAYAGVGNIRGFISAGPGRHDLASLDGTLGLQVRRVREFVYEWGPHALLALMTDGLTARAQLQPYPGLAMRATPLIAGVLMRDFRRGTDDASVVVARLGSLA
jgi:anti-sigma regulatory factor (Ser/Thr protein kinase)